MSEIEQLNALPATLSAPAGAKLRVRSRLQKSLPAGALGSVESPPQPDSMLPPPPPPATTSLTAGAASAAGLGGVALASAVVGAVLATVLPAAFDSEPAAPRSSGVPPVSAAAATVAPRPAAPKQVPEMAVGDLELEAQPNPPSTAGSLDRARSDASHPDDRVSGLGHHGKESSLSAERRMLDRARAELAAGRADRALAIAGEHAQRFPQGKLSEEREALAVRAFVMRGDAAEARQRAEAFRERYPNSFMTPAVETALDEER